MCWNATASPAAVFGVKGNLGTGRLCISNKKHQRHPGQQQRGKKGRNCESAGVLACQPSGH